MLHLVYSVDDDLVNASASDIAAVVLAAGRSTRMGERNKLLEAIGGTPMVVRVVASCEQAGFGQIVVVTGYQAESLRRVLRGRGVEFAHNMNYRVGIASSIDVGLQSVSPGMRGVMICLGDMVGVAASTLRRLIAALPDSNTVCVPTYQGRRGNPVLWGMARVDLLRSQLSGDRGARLLLRRFPEWVTPVSVNDAAVLEDVDTPEVLADLRRRHDVGHGRGGLNT